MSPDRSWRLCYWVELEVSAPDVATAQEKAQTVLDGVDANQLHLDDVWEVDPRTGLEVPEQ